MYVVQSPHDTAMAMDQAWLEHEWKCLTISMTPLTHSTLPTIAPEDGRTDKETNYPDETPALRSVHGPLPSAAQREK